MPVRRKTGSFFVFLSSHGHFHLHRVRVNAPTTNRLLAGPPLLGGGKKTRGFSLFYSRPGSHVAGTVGDVRYRDSFAILTGFVAWN